MGLGNLPRDPRQGARVRRFLQGLATRANDFIVAGALEVDEDGKLSVADGGITFAKMQNIATDSLIGRDTASSGSPESITLNATLSMTGSGALQRAALTGDVTASAGSNATTIANDAVTFAKMQNIATDSLIGRDTASSGDPENITLGSTLAMNGSGALGVVNAGTSQRGAVLMSAASADAAVLTTTETADGTYDANEQDMLNNLKVDVTAIHAALNDLKAKLRTSGALST